MASKYTNLNNVDSFFEEESSTPAETEEPPPKPPRTDFEKEDDFKPTPRERTGSFSLPELNMPAFLQVTPGSISHKITLIFCLGVGLLIGLITMGMLGALLGELLVHQPYPDMCLTTGCLMKAAQMRRLMNTSADPCTDFYTYSCGYYKREYPDETTQTDFITHLNYINEDKLLTTLENQNIRNKLNRTSAEYKLRTFFESCRDDFTRSKTGGKSLINAIEKDVGGWYALYDYNPVKWDITTDDGVKWFNSYLAQMFRGYGVMPFFKVGVESVVTEVSGNGKNVISLRNPDFVLGSINNYVYNDDHSKFVKTAFQEYVYKMLDNLWEDGGYVPPMPDQVKENTTADVLKVDTLLAVHAYWEQTFPDFGGFAVQLGPLSAEIKYEGRTMIDIMKVLKVYFPNVSLQPNTTVWVYNPWFMAALGNVVGQLTPREINNYVMFRMADTLAETLGWKYVHIKRVFHDAKLDWTPGLFDMNFDWCLGTAKTYMGYALSALFIKENFNPEQLQMANDIRDHMQKEFLLRVDRYSWMDQGTKTIAKDKLQNLVIQLGYADWLANSKGGVDDYYHNLQIGFNPEQTGNFFEAYKSLVLFYANLETQLLKVPSMSKDLWPEQIYVAEYRYKPQWNEIFMSVGLFQPPIYDANAPYYVNFGAIGRYLGDMIVRSIGYYEGAYFRPSGVQDTWWSADTNKTYNTNIKNCTRKLFDGQQYIVNGAKHNLTNLDDFVDPHIHAVASLRSALRASISYGQSHSTGGSMPGFQSEGFDQTFFISFGQTFCSNKDDMWKYWDWLFYNIPIDNVQLNKVVVQVPEFGTAFNCRGPISPSEGCDGF